MYRLTILYGHPVDATAFDRYYEDTHLPIASTMHNLTRWTITSFEPGPDGVKPEYHSAVDLYAESREAMEAVLESPEGQAASADVPNFATGGVVFLWGEEREIAVS